jgi:hypothetical protein
MGIICKNIGKSRKLADLPQVRLLVSLSVCILFGKFSIWWAL